MQTMKIGVLLASANAVAALKISLGLDNVCSGLNSQDTCLGTANTKCMWLQLDGPNLAGVGTDGPENRCMPCEMDGMALPCAATNAVYAGKNVVECQMSCGHQSVISKVSPCTDTSGQITKSQCFSKGESAGAKCMWTQFKVEETGKEQSHCGPCEVGGVGDVPCQQPGMSASGPGTTNLACMSQCDEACHGVPDCPKATPPKLSGLTPIADFGIETTEDAPAYFAVPVEQPYGQDQFEEATREAAWAAGWAPQTAVPPTQPVDMFGPAPATGPPLPSAFTANLAPPPPGIVGLPSTPGASPGIIPTKNRFDLLQEGLRMGPMNLILTPAQAEQEAQLLAAAGPPAPIQQQEDPLATIQPLVYDEKAAAEIALKAANYANLAANAAMAATQKQDQAVRDMLQAAEDSKDTLAMAERLKAAEQQYRTAVEDTVEYAHEMTPPFPLY